jgi:steroid delta-isomerase-like uncharacterized protein
MKNPILVISLVLLLCFTFGCQNKAEKAELEKFRAQAKLEEQNKELFSKEIEEWNKRNSDFYKDAFAPDYAFFSPSGNPKPMTRDEMVDEAKMIWAGFPDSIVSIKDSIAAGDMVFSRLSITGTHKGTFQGIPGTGNKVDSSFMNMCRIRNGKIVEEREEGDWLGLMMQLGMELKPKEVKK